MTCVSTSSYKKWELSLIRILLRCCGVVHRFVSLSAHCTHQFQCTKAATSCTHHGHCKDGNPYWLLFPRIIILTPWPQFIRCDSPSLSLHLSPLGCLIEGHCEHVKSFILVVLGIIYAVVFGYLCWGVVDCSSLLCVPCALLFRSSKVSFSFWHISELFVSMSFCDQIVRRGYADSICTTAH